MPLDILLQLLKDLFHLDVSVKEPALIRLNDINVQLLWANSIYLQGTRLGVPDDNIAPVVSADHSAPEIFIGDQLGQASLVTLQPRSDDRPPPVVLNAPFKAGPHFVFDTLIDLQTLRQPFSLTETAVVLCARPNTDVSFRTLDPRRNEIVLTLTNDVPTEVRLGSSIVLKQRTKCRTGNSTWTLRRIKKGEPCIMRDVPGTPPSVITVLANDCLSAWNLTRQYPDLPDETFVILVHAF